MVLPYNGFCICVYKIKIIMCIVIKLKSFLSAEKRTGLEWSIVTLHVFVHNVLNNYIYNVHEHDHCVREHTQSFLIYILLYCVNGPHSPHRW